MLVVLVAGQLRTRDERMSGTSALPSRPRDALADLTPSPLRPCHQWFITTAPAPFLDGKHCVFGKVIGQDSMLVVRKIENVPTGELAFVSRWVGDALCESEREADPALGNEQVSTTDQS